MRRKQARSVRTTRCPASISLLLLLAIFFTACTGAVDLVDSEAQPADTSPPAEAINAAASQAAEEATVAAESAVSSGPSSPAEAPQINRRVEVPDDLRVNWLIPFDGILPIYKPGFTPAGEAPLQDDELIIGVAWNGEAKAYPISVLRSREMVNDELAGIPTLVTW